MLVTGIQLYDALTEIMEEEKAKDILFFLEEKIECENSSSLAKNRNIDLAVAKVKAELISFKWDIFRWRIFCMLAVSGLIIAAFKLF